jgi:hypothetical protein
VLEDANIKLASVASDTLGKSGQAMLAALIAGQGHPGAVGGSGFGPQDPSVTASLGRFGPRSSSISAGAALLVQWRFVESETELIDQHLEQIGREETQIAEASPGGTPYRG